MYKNKKRGIFQLEFLSYPNTVFILHSFVIRNRLSEMFSNQPLPAGTHRIPGALSANIRQDLRSHFAPDFFGNFHIIICFLFQMEILNYLSVKLLHMFIAVAQIHIQHMRTAHTQVIGGKSKLNLHRSFPAEFPDDPVHIANERIVIAFPLISLCTEQMMRS